MIKAKTGDVVGWAVFVWEYGQRVLIHFTDSRELARSTKRANPGSRIAKVVLSK